MAFLIFSRKIIVPAILLTLLIGYVFRGDVEIVEQKHGQQPKHAEPKHGSIGNNYGGRGSRFREFDFFKLALQWPPTICRYNRKCCSANACCRGSASPRHFTIHGLWPSYNDGTWPACCTGAEFDRQEVSTLVDGLNKHWPTMSCNKVSTCHGKKGSFWAHEWEKHGTCASPVARDEYDYFIKTMNIYFKYNVTEVLNDAGYVPSNSEMYPLGGIIFAIQTAFHATPEIECRGDAIEELRLCLYKDFKLRECNVGSKITSLKKSCPEYVSLPAYTSTEIEDYESGTLSFLEPHLSE